MNHTITQTWKRFSSLFIVLSFAIICISMFVFMAQRSDAAKQNFYQVQEERELYRSGIWHLEKLNLEALNQEAKHWSARFPSSDNLSMTIGEISKIAENYKLKIISIAPGEKTGLHNENKSVASVLERIPIDMKLEGNYAELGKFLSELGNLDHGIMTVDRFQLDKELVESTRLRLSLFTSLYVKKESGQDILKENISGTSIMNRESGKSRFSSIEKDPFTKRVIGEDVDVEVHLEGIIYDPAQPIVLINGEPRRLGDRVASGMKIIEIHPNKIVLQKAQERIEIPLDSSS